MYPLSKRLLSTSYSKSSTSEFQNLVSKGLYDEALLFYKGKLHPFTASTVFTVPSVIKACAHSQTHSFLGFQVHCNVLKSGFDSESTVCNALISMYAKCSDTRRAHEVFGTMPERDSVSWSSMVNCFAQNGCFLDSLKMFKEMYELGFLPKPELIASVFSSCVKTENWNFGRQIHGLLVVDERIEKSVYVFTALVDFYGQCRDFDMALRVFDRMEERNVVSWSTMISGCVDNHDYANAIDCFHEMQVKNVEPNRVTLMSLLPACSGLGLITYGKEIHGYAIRHDFDSECHFSSALVHMYSSFGEALHLAKLIFDCSRKKDVVMWTSIIECYSRSENSAREAFRLFNMMQLESVLPNNVTVLALIAATTNLSSLNYGLVVHGYIFKSGLSSDIFIQNALISMYSKCGSLVDSVRLFEEMTSRDLVSWGAIIGAYGLYGHGEEALKLFHDMQKSGMKADAVTFLSVLSACDHGGLVAEAQVLFEQASKDADMPLTTEHYACYIDVLGRAGKLEDACDVVNRMPMKPSTRIWSSLFTACKRHGRFDIAESLADRLIISEPENPTNQTLLSMLYAESDNWLGVEQVRRGMKDRKLRKNYGSSWIDLKL